MINDKPHFKEKQSDFVARILKKKIISFELKPDDKISEHYLTNLFNISRPSIREALITLEKENLIHIRPQQGTYVTRIDIAWIKNFLFMRNAIEKAIIQEACVNFPEKYLCELQVNVYHQRQIKHFTPKLFLELDDNFHRIIYRAVNKEDIWESLISLSIPYDRLTYLLLLNEPQFYDTFVQHHVDTLYFLENKEVTQNSDHVGSTFPLFLDIINKYPQYIKQDYL